ncbi:hypothetical protein PAMA_004712 [Pampus argenteus]
MLEMEKLDRRSNRAAVQGIAAAIGRKFKLTRTCSTKTHPNRKQDSCEDEFGDEESVSSCVPHPAAWYHYEDNDHYSEKVSILHLKMCEVEFLQQAPIYTLQPEQSDIMTSVVVITSILLFKELAGSSAVTTVFVQKGNDLRLDVQEHVKLEEGGSFKWRFNNTTNIGRLYYNNNNPIISSTYKGKADVSPQNHSLILKNVQQSDSGDYTAVINGNEDQRVAEYKVIIQDPVSPVDVTVKSVSTSTESCNLTVSCTTQDSHIDSTLRCDIQSCKQEGGERSETTTSGSSLRIYLLNDSIICNHSNQVSWTADLREIHPLCPIKSGHTGISVCLVKSVVVSAGLIIMVSAVISVHLMERFKK